MSAESTEPTEATEAQDVDMNNANTEPTQNNDIPNHEEQPELPAENQIENEEPEEVNQRGFQDRINDIFRYFNHLLPNINPQNDEEDEDEQDEDDDEEIDSNFEEEEDDEETEEEYEQQIISDTITYNLALPSDHSYLGENFERVNAPKTVHEQNDEIQIPLLSFPGNEYLFWQRTANSNNIQLLPGQIMPLFFNSSVQTNLIKKRMKEQDPTIGFALTSNFYKKLMENANNPDLDSDETARLGILAEIIESREESSLEENENNSMMHGHEGLVIKVKGRERFKIKSVRREITGNLIANVVILPDLVLNKNPLLSTKRKNSNFYLESYLCKNNNKNYDSNNKMICNHAKAELLNSFMPLPAWIYRKYDCDYTICLIIKELNETFRRKLTLKNSSNTFANNENEIDYKDPLFFSNWLLNNFPFSDQMRINCLRFNSVNQRLIYMHSLLKSFTNINCSNCSNQLCASSDVFSLSNQGFMNPFLNPGGVVHETLTVHKIKNFKLSRAPPSTQHSWFPGYGWQICTCRNCNNHIGWKFTSTNIDLKPEKFFGLTRKAIRHTYNKVEDDDDDAKINENNLTSSS